MSTSGSPRSASTDAAAAAAVPFSEAWSDKIHLRNMRFYGWHGALPEETRLGQPFAVDATLMLDTAPAGKSDDLSLTIHYGHAYTLIKEVVEGRPVLLLESLAETLCARLLMANPLLKAVQIHVRKLSIPGLPATLDSVGIEILRTRRSH